MKEKVDFDYSGKNQEEILDKFECSNFEDGFLRRVSVRGCNDNFFKLKIMKLKRYDFEEDVEATI